MQLPEKLSLMEAREFLPEVTAVLEDDRPRMVFDCSQLQRIDSAGVEMLMQCLETIMRLDGDLKLAALTPEAAIILALTRVDRLFEVFSTVDEAVESFHGYVVRDNERESAEWYSGSVPGNGHAGDRRLAG
ncbi:MAG TPA: STAS domain-containing protein [Terriglobales bacterium]